MTTTLNQAAEAAKTLAKSMRAMLLVGEAIVAIDDIDKATAEAKRERDKARAEHREAIADLDAAREAAGEANLARETAQKEAQVIVADARAGAVKVVADAEAAATRMRDAAAKDAAALRDQVERERVVHNRVVNEWREKEAAAKAACEKIEGELAALRERVGA